RFSRAPLQPSGSLRGRLAALLFSESEWRAEAEVSLDVDRGIPARGLFVEALRKEHGGADVHRLPPELRELLALDLDVLHPPRVRRHGHRRKDFRERE